MEVWSVGTVRLVVEGSNYELISLKITRSRHGKQSLGVVAVMCVCVWGEEDWGSSSQLRHKTLLHYITLEPAIVESLSHPPNFLCMALQPPHTHTTVMSSRVEPCSQQKKKKKF